MRQLNIYPKAVKHLKKTIKCFGTFPKRSRVRPYENSIRFEGEGPCGIFAKVSDGRVIARERILAEGSFQEGNKGAINMPISLIEDNKENSEVILNFARDFELKKEDYCKTGREYFFNPGSQEIFVEKTYPTFDIFTRTSSNNEYEFDTIIHAYHYILSHGEVFEQEIEESLSLGGVRKVIIEKIKVNLPCGRITLDHKKLLKIIDYLRKMEKNRANRKVTLQWRGEEDLFSIAIEQDKYGIMPIRIKQ